MKIQWNLKSSKEKTQRCIHYKILGFKFLVGEYFEEFESTDEILLQEMKEILRKKLNQMNFHEYYKAIKKVGKGNFATVYIFLI